MPYAYTPSASRRWSLVLSAGIGDGHTAGQVRRLVRRALNDGAKVVELVFVADQPLDVTRVRGTLLTVLRQVQDAGAAVVLRDAPSALRSWALAGLFQFADDDAQTTEAA